MKKLLGGIALAMFVGGLLAQPAAAQWAGMPVYTSPAGYQGLLISADFGTGLNDDAKWSESSPMAYGGRIGYGTSGFNITGLFNLYDTKVDLYKKTPSFGANAAYTVLKQETGLAVNVFAGFGMYTVKDTTTASATIYKSTDIPFGVGIGFSPATTGSVGFEIWAAPRGQLSMQDPGVDKATRFGFGASGGVNVNFAQGFGIHAAIDWATFSEKTEGQSVYVKYSPLQVGAGLHYTFGMGN